ncbi:unnamed protein product [Rhizopus stolonifer]
MCKLSRKDTPKPLLPIKDETLAILVVDVEEQAALYRLSPLDLERRLYLSYIFSIHLIANSLILFLTPFFAPRDPIKIEWDTTSWIYNQLNNKAKDKKRPAIIFHIQSGNTIVEIGCSEVEAKVRIIEVMKRQLHLRMKLAKKMYEADTFGILIIGTEITFNVY